MDNHFSIISASIRPEIQEKITIGFLLVTKGQIHFYTSKNKISVAKELFSEEDFKSLKYSIKNVEEAVIEENSQKQKEKLQFSLFTRSIFAFEYLDYLSRYNSNILIFSKPKHLSAEGDVNSFRKLFEHFVDETAFLSEENKKETRDLEIMRQTYYPTLRTFFNVEKEVSSNEIPSLIMPVRIDLLGKNNIEVFAQSVELDRRTNFIENDIANLFFLRDALQNSKQFLISKEPSKVLVKQHQIWKNLRNRRDLEYIDVSEVEKIKEYAINHGVKPLIMDQEQKMD